MGVEKKRRKDFARNHPLFVAKMTVVRRKQVSEEETTIHGEENQTSTQSTEVSDEGHRESRTGRGTERKYPINAKRFRAKSKPRERVTRDTQDMLGISV